jgi:hypothetical protein
MAYDGVRNMALLFGGSAGGNETWEWDGVSWIKRDPATKPTGRTSHAMAYDSGNEKVVMFGGFTGGPGGENGETWIWDGTNWFQVKGPASATCTGSCVCTATTCPSARLSHAMVYDGVGGKVLLFGGVTAGWTYNDETWVWDGTDWTQLDPDDGPTARNGHAMAYDSARGRVLLFGGNTGSASDETWEWGGASWIQRYPVVRPPAQTYHSMVYDSARDKVVLSGGNETWTWGGGGQGRSGQIMQVAFDSSGISEDYDILSFSVFFNAGGFGDIAGTPTSGVDLLTWKHDHWEIVSSNGADPGDLASVTWETTDPVEIQTLLNSGLRKFNFAVVPTAPNGFLTDMGTIATDYAEVLVRYTSSE